MVVDLIAGTASDGQGGLDRFTGVDRVRGGDFADVFFGGLAAYDDFEGYEGRAGSDTIYGGAGYDEAIYALDGEVTVGVNVQLAIGTVTGDPLLTGTDHLFSVESVRGSLRADLFDAGGFAGGNAALLGPGGLVIAEFNNFQGHAGNDTVVGNGFTRISFERAEAGVTVNITGAGSGTASGDFSVGLDGFSGVAMVQGSGFADTLTGSDDTSGNVLWGGDNDSGLPEIFEGGAGNDRIDGGDGEDAVAYTTATAGVLIDLAAGTASGNASVGIDSLISIEIVIGSAFADTQLGSGGAEEYFIGGAGNDTFDGRGGFDIVTYALDGAGVVADLQAGTAIDGFGNRDSLIGIEGLEGSTFDDTLYGRDGALSGFSLIGIEGNDTIFGGTSSEGIFGADGNDRLFGGDGNDVVFGGLGNDAASGGAGNDSVFGEDGGDTIVGGGGIDTVDGGAGNDSASGGLGDDQVFGGLGNDVLYGDSDLLDSGPGPTSTLGEGNDTVYGGSGIDTLYGEDGADTQSGGLDNDVMYGGGDNDFIGDEAGNDTGYGDDGDDVVDMGTGSDIAFGGSGNDSLFGGGDSDTLDGGGDNDWLDGGAGNDTGSGGTGDDTAYGGTGNDSLFGGDGGDTLAGGDGNDSLIGGNGQDFLSADAGDDVISGAADDDTARGGAGNDLVDLGAGNADRVLYDYAGSGVSVQFSNAGDNEATASVSGTDRDSLIGVEEIVGSNFDDHIAGNVDANGIGFVFYGGNGNDRLDGGDDADVVYGDNGDDTFRSGDGDDTVYGGPGNDAADYTAEPPGGVTIGAPVTIGADVVITVHLTGGEVDTLYNIETILVSSLFTPFDDHVTISEGSDTDTALAGNDTVFLLGGDDLLYGAAGNDTFYGGFGNDRLAGGGDNDILYGEADADQLYGEGWRRPTVRRQRLRFAVWRRRQRLPAGGYRQRPALRR